MMEDDMPVKYMDGYDVRIGGYEAGKIGRRYEHDEYATSYKIKRSKAKCNVARPQSPEEALDKITNCVLVDFDVTYVQTEKRHKIRYQFDRKAKKEFLGMLAKDYPEMLLAKGWSSEEVTYMEVHHRLPPSQRKNYTVHHNIPISFEVTTGEVDYNNLNNFTLMRKDEKDNGDARIHRYMDQVTNRAETVSLFNGDIKATDEPLYETFIRTVNAEKIPLKITIPFSVCPVYLTPKEQRKYKKLTEGKKDRFDFSQKGIAKLAAKKISDVVPGFEDRLEHPENYPNLAGIRSPVCENRSQMSLKSIASAYSSRG